MTLILGVEDPKHGRSFVFSDSGIWRCGNDARSTLSAPKIWRDGNWVCGASGGWEMAQVARRTPMPPMRGDETEQQITDALLDWQVAVYRRCGEISGLIHGVDSTKTCDTPAIIVARGRYVFRCADCCVVRATEGYGAVGVWMYALGAMAAFEGQDMLRTDPDGAGRLTMKAVARLTGNVLGPFRWLCTDGLSGSFTEFD